MKPGFPVDREAELDPVRRDEQRLFRRVRDGDVEGAIVRRRELGEVGQAFGERDIGAHAASDELVIGGLIDEMDRDVCRLRELQGGRHDCQRRSRIIMACRIPLSFTGRNQKVNALDGANGTWGWTMRFAGGAGGC